jgi:hypothetical protein
MTSAPDTNPTIYVAVVTPSLYREHQKYHIEANDNMKRILVIAGSDSSGGA